MTSLPGWNATAVQKNRIVPAKVQALIYISASESISCSVKGVVDPHDTGDCLGCCLGGEDGSLGESCSCPLDIRAHNDVGWMRRVADQSAGRF